jgi:hypothetical protein
MKEREEPPESEQDPPAIGKALERVWRYPALWSVITALFLLLYLIAHRVVINEIRSHAMGVAIATAASLGDEALSGLYSAKDIEKEAFTSIQGFIDRIEGLNPDLRYIYIMRRSLRQGARPTEFEYVVDASETDENGNGVIDPEETSNPPGTPYDASNWPEMVQAWDRPGADPDVSPDPPYPDLISGYAPVKDRAGNTLAVVGVDITAATVGHKILGIRVVMASVWFVLCLLSGWVLRSYDRQKRLKEEMQGLVLRLQEALSSVKTLSGLLPICSGCKKIRDDKGYWEQVETYVSHHTGATFTHSLCPECLKELYPEQYEKLKKKGFLRYVPRPRE